MKDFCVCKDWHSLKDSSPNVFKWDLAYGWLITWIELTDEKDHTQIHNYGISINYCPMCGKKLEEPKDGR